jgi:hypothetical protein
MLESSYELSPILLGIHTCGCMVTVPTTGRPHQLGAHVPGYLCTFSLDTNFVIYALGWVDACNLRLRSPRSSDKRKSIVEQGDVSSGKRKRKPAPPRSKVWNHFTKVVDAEGSTVTMARCNYCGSMLRADSAIHGTKHLARHITSIHPDKLDESPL